MTQDEVMEMAQECNLIGMRPHLDGIYSEALVAFANLVAAKATEEANAKANASWTLMCKKMVAIEREACAKVCDLAMLQNQEAINELDDDEHIAKCFIQGAMTQLVKTSKAIRARGEQALAQPEQDGECKYCTHGCAACDARKLQKEAHDLL